MDWTPFRAVFGRNSLRAGRVAPWLNVGPALDGPGYLRLRRSGITHVVDLRDECCDHPDDMDGLGLRWRRVPVAAGEAPTHRQLNDLMRWLEAEADEVPSAVLYLHDADGRGRTTTVAVALLMHQDVPLIEAEALVTRAWPAATLSPSQRAFLEDLAARLSEPEAREPELADVSAAGDG
jgi:hypothetical protein